MAWDIDDLLGIPEPDDLNTEYGDQARALTDAARQRNIEIAQPAYDRIMEQVDNDVEDTDFKSNLDDITSYSQLHSNTGMKQTQFTANRMGTDINPTLQRTMDRQQSLGSAMTGVDTRNRARIDMREDRMDNMAKGIGMEDHMLQLELDRLEGLQDAENIKAGFPSSDSQFSLGGALKGGIAGYGASGGNKVIAGISAVLGAFF
jgi:hypothetical protein